MLEFCVLGPLTVARDGVRVSLRSAVLMRLLAALLCRAGRPVPVDDLLDAVWVGRPPAGQRKTLQLGVYRLRQTLGSARIDYGPSGYCLSVEAAEVDALRFADLMRRGGQALRREEPREASPLLREALDLWRGEPYADVATSALILDETHRLNAQWLQAHEQYFAAELDLGRHAGILGELTEWSRRYPYREDLRAQLMLALYRAGRQAESLEAYRDTRALLADQLGIEPGTSLQRLHAAILRADRVLESAPWQTLNGLVAAGAVSVGPVAGAVLGQAATDAVAPALTVGPAVAAAPEAALRPAADGINIEPVLTRGPVPTVSLHVPRQLPVRPQVFTGRAVEVADLEEIQDASTVVITAIDGMAGVGKTALAVHAAHQMADRYPDGQFFIDLHGYTDGVAPIEPGEALERMLRALGVSGERMPGDLDERAGLYRSRLADRRMLIVLDNAVTETQVAPLLPGAPGCLVLVTSRRRMAGLDHTHTLSLDTLPLADAVTLFRRSVGEGRLAGQPPDLLVELVELCGRLPLAIRIAAARLRSHPAWQLAHLVQRLRDQQHRLVELATGQRSVVAALDLSYQDLGVDQQRVYRLLGLHPGADIDAYAAAALLDATVIEAGRLLEQLLEAHLLQEPVPGRYRFHDLTRAHAARTASQNETEHGGAAMGRLLDYYRHTAAVAMDIAYPYERERRPQVSPAHTPCPDLSDSARALGWLDGELPNLLAGAAYAAQHGRPEHLLDVSTILRRHLRNRGPYEDAVALHEQALTTARATGQQAAEVEALIGLGNIHRLQGRYERATDHYQEALRLAHATGQQAAEMEALIGLGRIHRQQGGHEQAGDHYQQALLLARAAGHRASELETLVGLGHVHRQQGRYEQAGDHYQQALLLARDAGHRPGELNALVGLSHIHVLHGRYDPAIGHLQQALRLAHATGNRNIEQAALSVLGHIHRRQGRHGQATEDYQRLLDLAHEVGDRNYEFEARQGLGRLQHATGHPEAALIHHHQALALATELGQPTDQARAHDGLAHAHHTLHDHERARAHWRHAAEILAGLGVDHTDEEEVTVNAIRAHLAEPQEVRADGGR